MYVVGGTPEPAWRWLLRRWGMTIPRVRGGKRKEPSSAVTYTDADNDGNRR